MKKARKVIGIPGWSTGENSWGVTKTYLDFITEQLGDVRIIMPSDDVLDLDLLFLPGGMDMNPTSYGERPHFMAGGVDPFKQSFFETMLPQYIKNGTPVFGICLGFQQLAAFFGSRLTQHLKWHKDSPGRWQKGHEILLTDEGQNIAVRDGKKKYEVNSHHHQGLLNRDMSDELTILAVDKESCDGNTIKDHTIVEAFRHSFLPVGAVQWHPEEWYDELAISLAQQLMAEKGVNILKAPEC